MKLTLRLIENLRRILQGESVPYSSLPKLFVETMIREELMDVEYHGSRRNLRSHNPVAFASALSQCNEALCDLDAAERMISGDNSRATQASLSGNSKIRSERSCPGFLVNAYSRIECMLNGRDFIIEPTEGSTIYVADWNTFIPPEDALIVGVENMENFLQIRSQETLFSSYLKEGERHILFVSRYAFSADLGQWLKRIPNRYLHYGDFDLGGISIFLTQFKPFVGNRGSYLIPFDVEERLKYGSRQRYDEQYSKYHSLSSTDPELKKLISLIHHYRRCYDQEGYIKG